MVSNTDVISLKEPLHCSRVINPLLLGSCCPIAERHAENSKQLSVRELHALDPAKLQVFRNMVFKMAERRDFSVPGVVFVLVWFIGRFCLLLFACLFAYHVLFSFMGRHSRDEGGYGETER